MYLMEFNRNGDAEIKMSESEINALSNCLYEYFEEHKEDKLIDKRLYDIRKSLYIIYEIIHHNACFDDATIEILQKMPKEKDVK